MAPPRPTHEHTREAHQVEAEAEKDEAAVAVATKEGEEAVAQAGEGVEPLVGALTDWRAWVAQQGGNQPGQTPPFMFPGILPITDLLDPRAAVPPYNAYQNTQTGLAMPQQNQWVYQPYPIKPADPWEGWTAQLPTVVATFAGPVVLSDVTPNTGAHATGFVTRIDGQGFTGATAVNWIPVAGGAAVPGTVFSIVNDTYIQVTSPITLTATTAYNIQVASPNGNVTLYNAWYAT